MMALLLSLEVTANVPSDAAVDRQTSSVQLLEDGTRTCKHYLEGLWVMSIYHTARRDRRSRRSFKSMCVFPAGIRSCLWSGYRFSKCCLSKDNESANDDRSGAATCDVRLACACFSNPSV
jgi:hypothetical protein